MSRQMGQPKKQKNRPAGQIAMGLFALVMMALPWAIESPYLRSILVFVGIYAIGTLGLVMLIGYAGQISLGQSVFYGVGAYTSAILTTRYHLSPWLCLLLAALLSGGLAFAIGRPVLKMRGHVLAGATFALCLIFTNIAGESYSVTGGHAGIAGIPRFTLGGFVLKTDIHYYYLVWIVALAALMFSLNLVNSRVGRALRSMNVMGGGSEDAAKALGVNVASYKAKVFALSAVYASVAGSIWAHYLTAISPLAFDFQLSVLLLIMAVVGGVNSVWGALSGAFAVVVLKEFLGGLLPKVLGGATGVYESIGFGVILVASLVLLRGGLTPAIQSFFQWAGRKAGHVFGRMTSHRLTRGPE